MIRLFTLVAAPGGVESQVAQGIATDSERAQLDSVKEGFCAGFVTQQCQSVHATIETGAEKGKRVVVQLSAPGGGGSGGSGGGGSGGISTLPLTFGPDTLVAMKLAAARIPATGPLRVQVTNKTPSQARSRAGRSGGFRCRRACAG